MTVYAPLAMPRARRSARINRAKRPFPMKTVTIASLAASLGAFAPAFAVWRGAAAREAVFSAHPANNPAPLPKSLFEQSVWRLS